MRVVKSLLIVIPLLLCLFLLGEHMLRKGLESTDYVGPISDLVSTRLANAVTLPRPMFSSSQDSRKAVETYVNALKIENFLESTKRNNRFPISSKSLEGLDRSTALDGWGHPYCILRDSGRIGFLSAGASNSSFSDCQILPDGAATISDLEVGRMYKHPSGWLVLVFKTT